MLIVHRPPTRPICSGPTTGTSCRPKGCRSTTSVDVATLTPEVLSHYTSSSWRTCSRATAVVTALTELGRMPAATSSRCARTRNSRRCSVSGRRPGPLSDGYMTISNVDAGPGKGLTGSRCSFTARPTAGRPRARRSSPASQTARTRPGRPGRDVTHGRRRARPPRSPTTWRARSSTPARATRTGSTRSATMRSPAAPPLRRSLLPGLGRLLQGPDPASRRATAVAREHPHPAATDQIPLPRFWYLPRDLKAAVVMTGDHHGVGTGTTARFDQMLDSRSRGLLGRRLDLPEDDRLHLSRDAAGRT